MRNALAAILTEINGNLSAANLLAGAVTTDKLLDLAVTVSKLADGAVTNAKLAGSIDPAKITGTAVVTGDSRLSDQRTPLDNSVTSAKIVDGSIVNADINASAAIAYSKIAGTPTSLPPSGTAGGGLTGSYPNPTIASNAVGAAQIVDGSVGAAEIADGSVGTAEIANGAVNEDKQTLKIARARVSTDGSTIVGKGVTSVSTSGTTTTVNFTPGLFPSEFTPVITTITPHSFIPRIDGINSTQLFVSFYSPFLDALAVPTAFSVIAVGNA